MSQVAATKTKPDATEAPELARPVDRDRSRLLGARLQELRRMRGLSLKKVAEEVGVSSSFLSMVERGQTDLSLTRFSRLTEYFDVQPSELLMELNASFRPPEFSDLGGFRTIPRGDGVEYHVLQDDNPQMIYVRMAPGSKFNDYRSHRGSEFWFVLEGAPELHYGSETYRLEKGQTARFSSTLPHGLANPGDTPATLMALCSVPYW
jgi:transcriptional regulator with XRE-family HTH domain